MLQTQIAELTDSSELFDDPAALRRRFEEDGYVFVRNAVDTELIDWARAQYCDKLADDGLVERGDDSATWTGTPKRIEEPCDTLGTTVWSRIIADDAVNHVCSSVLGEELVWVPIVRHRCTLPTGPADDGEDVVKNRHQDSYFNEGLDFAICWMPMMDIPRERGGLAIAAGLQEQGDFHEPVAPFPIPEGAIPDDAWRTTDYLPGDMLVFHKAIPHAGLRNQTDRIRLSLDLRVIGKSAPQPIIGEVSALEGGDVWIRTTEGDERHVVVDDDTFIRDIFPTKRLSVGQLDKIASVGSRVLAVAGPGDHAPLIRPIKY